MNILSKIYAKWFLQRTLKGTNPFIYRIIRNDVEKKQWVCELSLYGTKKKYSVSMHVNRSAFRELGLSKPIDFEETPLTVDKSHKNDKKEIQFVKQFNIDNLRFVCTERLHYLKPLKIVIPALFLQNNSATIDFRFDAAVGFGGQILLNNYLIGLGDRARLAQSDECIDKMFKAWQQHNPGWHNKRVHSDAPEVGA